MTREERAEIIAMLAWPKPQRARLKVVALRHIREAEAEERERIAKWHDEQRAMWERIEDKADKAGRDTSAEESAYVAHQAIAHEESAAEIRAMEDG